MHSMHKLLMQCATATVAVILATPAMPQEPAVQGGTIKTQVNLVNLFATVRDRNKRIVPTLKQEDFRISEDNQDQKIAFFSREVALPITLALLLDTSGSEQDMLSGIQDAGSQFISRIIRKGDEALVMSFDSNVDLLSDFTDEKSQLERAIHKTRIMCRIRDPEGGIRVQSVLGKSPVRLSTTPSTWLAVKNSLRRLDAKRLLSSLTRMTPAAR